MLPPDFQLQLVTDHRFASHADWPEIIEQAVQGGANLVQLRDKQADNQTLIELGLAIQKKLKPYNVPLIINDRVEVAIAINADGVHLGQGDACYRQARERLGANKIIGLTINNFEQAQQADQDCIDYFGVGPVFATATKPDATAPMGLDGLSAICEVLTKPVIAIGGITPEHIKPIQQSGAAGIAVVSAIMNHPSPKYAARAISPTLTTTNTQ